MKESAALLPLYTACAELAITGFRNQDGRPSRPALWTHAALLVLPLIAGLVWISGWVFRSIASVRDFSIGERLLTEPRVLVDYIGWTLLPNLNSLTFYHDSLGYFDMVATSPLRLRFCNDYLALLMLFAVAIWQRKARPLFCLGILWFFAGHSMTATVIHWNSGPSICSTTFRRWDCCLRRRPLLHLNPALGYQLQRK